MGEPEETADGDWVRYEDAVAAVAEERERWRSTVEALLPMAEESVTRPNLDLVCLDARGMLKRA